MFIGYHKEDVSKKLKELDNQIAFVDAAIKQEREAFDSLFFRKLKQMEQLQTMLDEALAAEDELKKRRVPL